ncbi:MAG: hypothetical protein KAG62_01045 [Caulobacter sp.]|nr:hypothetical protein [Caulobacter sp.]
MNPPGDPRPTVGTLLDDPAVRAPLKAVLRGWRGRDPVDAAEDAGLLALALERAADERRADAARALAAWRGHDQGGRHDGASG